MILIRTDVLQCVVQSYLQWLTDCDYDTNCSLCEKPLAEEETIRLQCLRKSWTYVTYCIWYSRTINIVTQTFCIGGVWTNGLDVFPQPLHLLDTVVHIAGRLLEIVLSLWHVVCHIQGRPAFHY